MRHCIIGDIPPNTLGKFLDAEGALASLEDESIIAPAIKGFGLHQGGTGSVLSVICGRDGARPSQ